MLTIPTKAFAPLNRGYARVFRPGHLSLRLVVPIEAYSNTPVPEISRHLEGVQRAEALGFVAAWLRDVPFNVPSFGDAGQVFDPFVYLGALAVSTKRIALGVASLVLPLRHPAHVAKAAASVNQLSGGRLLLGVASGDRPDEYRAMVLRQDERGARFRESFAYIRRMATPFPDFDNGFGHPNGQVDLVPKPVADRLPLLITGGAQQSSDWGATHADGWMTYPLPVAEQARVVEAWRCRVNDMVSHAKLVMQPLYLDLAKDPGAEPSAIHLGIRVGSRHLVAHLRALQAASINHVALNLRFNRADIEDTLGRLATEVLVEFQDRELQ